MLFDGSLEPSVLPTDWKIGKVAPLHNSRDKYSLSNYRPILLTSILCKLAEHIIAFGIAEHLESNYFFSHHQYRFFKRFSCETRLLTFRHDLHLALDEGFWVECEVRRMTKSIASGVKTSMFLFLCKRDV